MAGRGRRPLADIAALEAGAPEAGAPEAAAPEASGGRVPLGVWLILAAGLATLGASAILIRLAGVEGAADPRVLVLWRLAFTCAILLPVGLRGAARAELARRPRRDLALVAAAGVLLGLHFQGWFASLAFTSVASATVLVTMGPLFIAVLGVAFLRERPRAATWAAIASGVTGAALIALGDRGDGQFPQAALGNALAFGAALCIAVYLLLGRSVRQRLAWGAFFLPINVAALGVAVVVAVGSGVPLAVDLPTLGLCLAMALGPGLLGHGALSYSVRYVPAATVGLLTLAEPVVSAGLAWALFKEAPTPLAAAGMVVVLGALAAVLRGRDA